MIQVNELIQCRYEDKIHIFRILYINHELDIAVLILIQVNSAFKKPQQVPRTYLLSSLLDGVQQGINRILSYDPWLAVPIQEQDLSKAEIKERDRLWEIVHPLCQNIEILLNRDRRAEFIRQAMLLHNVPKPTLYRYLQSFWIGGQTIHALVPRFKTRGGSGKERLGSVKKNSAKRGRPRKYEANLSSHGVNIDKKLRDILVQIGQKYFEVESVPTLEDAFDSGLLEHFVSGYEKGSSKPVFLNKEKLPTFTQFLYWYGKDRKKRFPEVIQSRLGLREFNLNYRGLPGESTSEANGPGAVFQIDSTPFDLNMVKTKNRSKLVGRATLYIVSDVFSRMVVGFWIGFEKPSWRGAIQALTVTVQDKVIFCKSMGIEIESDQWVSHYLPHAILADRGEFDGYNSDLLVKEFGVRVSNAAPYRADWKGIVERAFRSANARVRGVKGAVTKKQRGQRDTRLDATVTLQEARKLVTLGFLKYNQTHEIKKYPRTLEMKAQQVRAIPLQLWNWGIENKSGFLKKCDPEKLKLYLLTRANGVMTENGLRYKNVFYTNHIIESENWRGLARATGTWTLEIAYDDWDTGMIYMIHPKTHEFIESLQSKRADAPGSITWIEYDQLVHTDRVHEATTKTELLDARLQYKLQNQQIIDQATLETNTAKKQQPKISKSRRLKDIRVNQAEEKLDERSANSTFLRQAEVPLEETADDTLFDLSTNQLLQDIIKSGTGKS
jgi:putative transposase